jgi:hypothetical protein
LDSELEVHYDRVNGVFDNLFIFIALYLLISEVLLCLTTEKYGNISLFLSLQGSPYRLTASICMSMFILRPKN